MMESHSDRLEKDLALLRYCYEEKHGDDSHFDTELLTVIGRAVTNLDHCRRSEAAYLAADELSDWFRGYIATLANVSGRDDWPNCELIVPEPRDAAQQRAALADLRAQLEQACWGEDASARAIGKTATAIVRAEIQLQQTLKCAGVYLEKDALVTAIDERIDRIVAFSRENIAEKPEWYRIVDEILEIGRKEQNDERISA